MCESGLTLLRNYVYHTIFFIIIKYLHVMEMTFVQCGSENVRKTSIWVVMLVRSLMDHKNRQVILTC